MRLSHAISFSFFFLMMLLPNDDCCLFEMYIFLAEAKLPADIVHPVPDGTKPELNF